MNIIIQSIRKDGFKKIMIGNKEREEIKKHHQTYLNPVKNMMHGKAGDEEYYYCFGCSLGREIQLRGVS